MVTLRVCKCLPGYKVSSREYRAVITVKVAQIALFVTFSLLVLLHGCTLMYDFKFMYILYAVFHNRS